MRIAREGWPIILSMAAAGVLITLTGLAAGPAVGGVLGALSAVLTGWSVWFFRDPDRAPPAEALEPSGQVAVISPADGRVIKIDRAPLPRELRPAGDSGTAEVFQRIAIFLNLFDVHVNRVPLSGRIIRVAYVPGRFFNASLDKASEHNERSAALLLDPHGRSVAFVQIAGLVAWRIVNHLREGQQVAAGERFGLIRFGSRAEVYLPLDAQPLVQVGQRVRAGETIMARMAPSPAPVGGLA